MLSTTCKAAIKSVVYLASKLQSGEKSGLKEIAKYIDENEHTVGKLLQRLVKDEIIYSVKGPHGGFYISKEQLHQPIITIINAIDGRDVFKQCALSLTTCSETRPCPLHNDYKAIRNEFASLCAKKKISDLRKGVLVGTTFLTKKNKKNA